MHGIDEKIPGGTEGEAYQRWAFACRKMVAAKAAYDAAQLEVRDALQVLANIVAPQDSK